jgi:hypothetical protein
MAASHGLIDSKLPKVDAGRPNVLTSRLQHTVAYPAGIA